MVGTPDRQARVHAISTVGWESTARDAVGLSRETQFSPSGKFVVSRQGPQAWFVATLDDLPRRRALMLDSAAGAEGFHRTANRSRPRICNSGPVGVFVRSLSGAWRPADQISKSGGHVGRCGERRARSFYRNRGWLRPPPSHSRRSLRWFDETPSSRWPEGPYYDFSRELEIFVMPWFVGGEEVPPPFYITGWFTELAAESTMTNRSDARWLR